MQSLPLCFQKLKYVYPKILRNFYFVQKFLPGFKKSSIWKLCPKNVSKFALCPIQRSQSIGKFQKIDLKMENRNSKAMRRIFSLLVFKKNQNI